MRPWEGFRWTFSVFFGPFLTQMGPKHDFWPPDQHLWRSAAIKHRKFNEDLQKLSQSLPQNFAVRPNLNWLRYSSFSVILLVKWPNLRAWPNFRALQPTMAKHDNVSKRNWNFEIRNNRACIGCASQKCSNHVFRKWSDFFLGSCRKNPLNIAILPIKTLFSRKHFCYFCPDFR